MKVAKIYIPTKTAMQSGKSKNSWILEYPSISTSKDYLMNWTSSENTTKQVKIYFKTKEEAIRYAKLNKIKYTLIEPKKSKFIIKSYADNFK